MDKCHKFNHIYLPTYLNAVCHHSKKLKWDDPDLII